MKKLILPLLLGLVFVLYESCTHDRTVYAPELNDTVITPSRVHFETKAWLFPNKKKTWGLMETKDGKVLGMGYITLVDRGDTNSVYRMGDMNSTYALPNVDYWMKHGIVHNWNGQQLEVMTVNPEPEPCANGEGIKFDKDSIFWDAYPPQKLVAYIPAEGVSWTSESWMKLPRVISIGVDSSDVSSLSAYSLAFKHEKGNSCEYLHLHQDVFEIDKATTRVYIPSSEYQSRFREYPDSVTFDGRKIFGYIVVKDHNVPKGVKKHKHKKRERSSI